MSNSPRHRRRHYSRHGRSESSYERSPDRRRDAASQPHRGADDVNGNAPTVLIKPGAPGGRYIPPAKLRLLMAEANLSLDKASKEYQRVEWDKLKKALNGNINKLNISNIKTIIPELIHLNLIRGRGLFCRAIMRAQAFSPTFTPVYAALVAVINTKLPLVGELLVTRLVVQFRKAFRRDQKALCLATTSFLAQLTNQR
ncbi:pre-mRNA-splicing factor cwc22, partial [Spiromyces aspiralis]